MPESMEKMRQNAVDNVIEAARQWDRLLSGTNHPGIDNERLLAVDKLRRRLHELDEIDGNRERIGKVEKWQEEAFFKQ